MDQIITNQSPIKDSVNSIQNLEFDVVALPQNSVSQILDVRTGAVFKPINIKIRVRNKKEQMKRGHGVISVPKLSISGPRKLRLVSSDQTIISFDLFMGTESVKQVSKKSHSKFLQLFKPSRCLNNQNDDDNYPYVPSSSNASYKTRNVTSIDDLQDGKIINEKISLKKNLPSFISKNTTLQMPTFLGKCKPGGCLDPPFGEDKYIYKHIFDQKHAEIQERIDEKYIEDNIVSEKIVHESGSMPQRSSCKSSVEEIYPHLITYPPALSPSEIFVQDETQSKKSKLSTSSENKIRKSFNEFSDPYFMPTRRKRSKIDVKLSTELLEDQSKSYNSNNINTDTYCSALKKEPLQLVSLSNEELLSQTPETKISVTKIKDKNNEGEKIKSPDIISLKDSISRSFGKLSDTIIQVPQKLFSSEASATELTLNYSKFKDNRLSNEFHEIKLEGKEKIVLDTMDFDRSKSIPFIHKDTIINDDLPTTTKDNERLKKETKINKFKENNMFKNTPDNLMENQSLVSQKPASENKTLRYNILKTDESNMKFKVLTPSDDVMFVSSNTALTEYLQETENLPQETNTRTSKLYHNSGKSKGKCASITDLQAPLTKQIKDTELVDQINLEKIKIVQQQVNTPIINYLDKKYTNGIPNTRTANKVYEDDHHKSIISMVENEALRYNLSNTDENRLKLKPPNPSRSVNLTSANSEFTEHLPETEDLPQAIYTKTFKIYKYIGESIKHNEPVTVSRSRESVLEQKQVKAVTDHKNVEPLKTSQAIVGTTRNNYEEKIYVNDLRGKENANNIECKDDHDKSIISTIEKESLKYNLSSTDENELELKSFKPYDNISLVTNTTVSTAKIKYEEKIGTSDSPGIENECNKEYKDHQKSVKSSSGITITNSDISIKSANLTMNRPNIMDDKIIFYKNMTPFNLQNSSTLRISDKKTADENFIYNEDSRTFSQSLSLPTSLDLSQSLVLQEEKGSASQILVKDTINGEPVYDKHRNSLASSQILKLSSLINVPNGAATPSGHLKVHSHEDEPSINSTISFKRQSFGEEGTIDGHSSSSRFFPPKLQESLDKVIPKTIPQLQSKTSKVSSIILDTKKTRQSAHDSLNIIEENLKSHPKVFLNEFDSDVNQIKLNTPKVKLENLRAVFTSEDKNESKINENEVNENFHENKKSSIKIYLGFHTYVDDNNETLIRTFDTDKHLDFDLLDNITVMKSTLRTNDREIRIPVTSKTDITLQMKKPFNKGNNAKSDIDDTPLTNKVPEKSLSKTILLKQTLDSVYENLVPIESIIRNLKQEAEFLTQQHVLFREILNELKTKSVKTVSARKNCNCNKLS